VSHLLLADELEQLASHLDTCGHRDVALLVRGARSADVVRRIACQCLNRSPRLDYVTAALALVAEANSHASEAPDSVWATGARVIVDSLRQGPTVIAAVARNGGRFTVNADKLDVVLEATEISLSGPNDLFDENRAGNVATLILEAHAAGALAAPPGLAVSAIGDDTPGSQGIVIELAVAGDHRFALTNGWRELDDYGPDRDEPLPTAEPARQRVLALAAVSMAACHLNALLETAAGQQP
jgi:hypothetical protein